MHLLHDVATSHKFSFNINLWNGGPIRVLFDRSAQSLISQNIHILVLFDTIGVHEDDNVSAEATLGHLSGTFHEHTDIVLIDPSRDMLGDFGGG